MRLERSTLRCLTRIASIAAIAGLGLAAFRDYQLFAPNDDNSWILVFSERILSGGKYYRDVFEWNPPLIALILAPSVFVSRFFHLAIYSAFILEVLGIIALSLTLSASVIDWFFDSRPWLGDVALLVIAAVLVGIGHHFGQRDHLAIAIALPGLLLYAARVAGYSEVGRRSTFVMALMGCGLMIKPLLMSALLPMMCLRALRLRSFRALLDRSLIPTLAVAALYFGVILVFFPEYFLVVQLARRAYSAYDYPLWELVQMGTPLAKDAVILWVIVELVSKARIRWFFRALLASDVVFLMVAILTKKPWFYRFLPAQVVTEAVMSLLLLDLLGRVVSWSKTDLRSVFFAAITCVVVANTAGDQLAVFHQTYLRQDLLNGNFATEAVKAAAGGTIWVAATNVFPQFPVVPTIGVRWASRFPCLSLMPRAWQLSRGNAAEQQQARELFNLTTGFIAEDLKRYRPDAIAIQQIHNQGMDDTPLLSYFLQDPRFRQEWSNYRQSSRIENYVFYTRKPDQSPSGAAARTKIPVGAAQASGLAHDHAQ